MLLQEGDELPCRVRLESLDLADDRAAVKEEIRALELERLLFWREG